MKQLMKTVGVKFKYNDKIYRFNAGGLDLQVNDRVVADTEKGICIGIVVRKADKEDASVSDKSLKRILRKADKNDLDLEERNLEKGKEVYQICMEEINNCELPMKLVNVECFFDNSKIIFYFTAENRVDFRELVKRLAQIFHIRIEMRQIGVRNETKMLGGMGNCGREFCCSSFLQDFVPVSVRIAKDQNMALNPSKISGVCGRLMCCLTFEHETYVNFKKNMPKCGKRVVVSHGKGKILEQNVIEQKVTVELEDGRVIKVPICEVKEDAPAKKRRKRR